MLKLAFISRHEPTQKQREFAEKAGIELDYVGDRDAYTFDPEEFSHYNGCVVVNAIMALRLLNYTDVAVFENVNRAAEGEPPKFESGPLRLYTLDGSVTQFVIM